MQSTWNINRILFFFGICFLSFLGNSQTDARLGFLPTVNFNLNLKKDWDLNFKYQSRHYVFQSQLTSSERWGYSHSNSDLSFLAGKKTGLNSKFIGGFSTRFANNRFFFQLNQQFVLKKKYRGLRLAHRFALDETFAQNTVPRFRIRYRLGVEIPLQGKKIDVKEFYFKMNLEVLNTFEKNQYYLELRGIPVFGYVISEKQKIEFGFDNRLDRIITSSNRISNLLIVSWYL